LAAAPLDSGSIRLVPLAGLGNFGLNCLALEAQDGIVVIDCGAQFPRDDRGIESVHADFTWLFENAPRVRGVVLTHGHEDHIGGLPHLISKLKVPVFGPPHAIALSRRRLEEHHLSRSVDLLHSFVVGEIIELGSFVFEAIRVSHSIVDASALSIQTPAGRVVHTGDFNFDPSPPDGEPTDEAQLRALGDTGVDLLLSDSTNIDSLGPATSEADVAQCLSELVESARSRVIVAVFSSNVQRLKTLGDIAIKTNRRVCLLGRSVRTHVEIAHTLGRLDWPSGLLVPPEALENVPGEKLLVVAGGTQAEYHSTMARIARDDHRYLRASGRDTVIFSSRIIPGNEPDVYAMYGDFLRRGVKLHSKASTPLCHTSGHANREEQTRMIRALRPTAFVPVHGTIHHMSRHAELARNMGVGEVELIENGEVLRFEGERLEYDGRVPSGTVQLGRYGERIDDDVLRQRGNLSRAGVVFVSIPLWGPFEQAASPAVTWYGVPALDAAKTSAERLSQVVESVLDRFRSWRRADVDLEREVRRAIRRVVNELSGGRPEVIVQAFEVDADDD
jgi:ribonuclease J